MAVVATSLDMKDASLGLELEPISRRSTHSFDAFDVKSDFESQSTVSEVTDEAVEDDDDSSGTEGAHTWGEDSPPPTVSSRSSLDSRKDSSFCLSVQNTFIEIDDGEVDAGDIWPHSVPALSTKRTLNDDLLNYDPSSDDAAEDSNNVVRGEHTSGADSLPLSVSSSSSLHSRKDSSLRLCVKNTFIDIDDGQVDAILQWPRSAPAASKRNLMEELANYNPSSDDSDDAAEDSNKVMDDSLVAVNITKRAADAPVLAAASTMEIAAGSADRKQDWQEDGVHHFQDRGHMLETWNHTGDGMQGGYNQQQQFMNVQAEQYFFTSNYTETQVNLPRYGAPPCTLSWVGDYDGYQPAEVPHSQLAIQPTAGKNEKRMLCIKGVPNDFDQQGCHNLIWLFVENGCDFLYAPVDHNSGALKGYFFVHMRTMEGARIIRENVEGFNMWPLVAHAGNKFKGRNSQKVAKVVDAEWESLEAAIEYYRNNDVMHHEVREDFKPMLFDKAGLQISFPAPTRKLNKPRGKGCRPEQRNRQRAGQKSGKWSVHHVQTW